MTETERLIANYIGAAWTKEEVMKSLKLSKEELDAILKKYNWKFMTKSVSRAASDKRIDYSNKNIIIRKDKKLEDCPFICVTVHKKLNSYKKTVFSMAIKDNGKKIRVRSKNLVKILRTRNDFLRTNNKNKLKQIRKIEFKWFITHPVNKFFFKWFLQLFNFHFSKH